MNKRIKELAEQAGLSREFSVSGLWLADDAELERFAELVRQDEREACAKLCDDWFASTAGKAIRERGEK
jgi:hypothetical protein